MKVSSDGATNARGNVQIAPANSKWEKLRRPSFIHRLRALDIASKKEKESLQCKDSELVARATLTRLEECFTCPICYEVMACPYSTRQCGHSFCAICILTWSFTRSSLLGGFDLADCPNCRNALIDASQTLPFTPNTTARDSIRGMINTISKVADSINALASDSLAEWRKDGRAQGVWGQKERDGNTEMSQLAKLWPEVNSDDYIAIKKRLGISVESDLALIA
ncbi:hypothetical protein K503DRAFT_292724 [Rhizopogon vinicolor AM-OR11-026]|uniref:RING-type domain-containing protein n=1 Tax=Rhizopogon vinicolor AM-OR11-026 TaxID=1314800 RepID=A0A1B7ND39_9AGAM|nr:hypothetical protein K503DRAFT_292724 [Rhizopogon vinicolor AM-OR11-026]